MNSRRAFSLLELAVALAIAGLTTTAALTATVTLQKSLVATRKATELGDDARFTLEHVLSPLRIAGGGAIRPWQAISTTCRDDARFPLPPCVAAPAREATGRLHIVKLEGFGQCPIAALSGTTLTVTPVGGVCCVSPANGYPTGAPFLPVVLFPRDDDTSRAHLEGAAWRARSCTPLTGGSCGCTLSDPRLGYDAPPPKTSVNLVDADFVGGFVARGAVTSWYVEPANQHLMALFDVARVGVAQSTEMTPKVFSFDTRLGYDSDPVDGVLDQPLVRVPDKDHLADLRVVRVGLALAARVADDRATTNTLFGVVVDPPGKRVVVAEGNATLRAVGVFQ